MQQICRSLRNDLLQHILRSAAFTSKLSAVDSAQFTEEDCVCCRHVCSDEMQLDLREVIETPENQQR